VSAKRQLAEVGKRRTAPPEERREQLIQATIRCVADRGLADTTIATVAQEAGLSQGIVNLHFRSKDGLLTETLRYLADEYRTACHEAAAAGEVNPVDGLLAMVELDFRRSICSRDKLAVWFAFWASGVSGRPIGGSASSGTGPMTTWSASSALGFARRAAMPRWSPASSPTDSRR
jgi:AcrR family transcriptional regulator